MQHPTIDTQHEEAAQLDGRLRATNNSGSAHRQQMEARRREGNKGRALVGAVNSTYLVSYTFKTRPGTPPLQNIY